MTNTKKIFEFLKKTFRKTFSVFAILALSFGLGYGISTLTTTSVPTEAFIYCPNGNWNGVGCLNSYTCPNGWLVSGTGCFEWVTTYSCPNGGAVSGSSCIASTGSPVFVGDNCWAGGTFVSSVPSVISTNFGNTTLTSYGGPLPSCFGPAAGIPAGTVLGGTGLTPIGSIQGYRAGFHTSGAYGAASTSGYEYRQEANPVYNNTDAVFIPESTDLTGIGCQTVTVGQPTNCTYAINNTSGLPTTLDYLSGELYVQGRSETYLFNNTNSALDGSGNLVVSNIPTSGGTTGSPLPVTTALIDSSTNTVGNLPANKLPNLTLLSGISTLTMSDIGNLKIKCSNDNFVIIPFQSTSTTTTCSGVMPPGKAFSSSTQLKLKIGNASDIDGNKTTCFQDLIPDTQLNGNTQNNTFICALVPSGSMTAAQAIFGSIYETNSPQPSYADTFNKTNVYSGETFFDGKIAFLKDLSGNTSAYNNVLHKDWRQGVNTNQTRIALENFKTYRDINPGTFTSSKNNDGSLSNPSYLCKIGVRPSGSNGNFINLIHDTNADGEISNLETSTDIPYNTQTNRCEALFTNQKFSKTIDSNEVSVGQPGVTTNLAKNYNWEVKIDVIDTSVSSNPTIATFNSGVGFKFAAIIPGG